LRHGDSRSTRPEIDEHSHARYLRAERFGSLDGLRCLAVLPVIWHHSTPRPLDGLLGRGPLGVDLFFAISGFLITTLLLRERHAHGTVAVRRFYARRGLRIFPAYYLVLASYALHGALALPAGASRDHFLRSLPYWATYTANWFVDFDVAFPVVFAFGWSLATEEQFYAVWPWLARAPRWAMPLAALTLLAADQGVELGVLGNSWPPLARRITASIASPICMGALLACALDAPGTFALLRRALGLRCSSPLALFALAALVGGRAPAVAVPLAMTALVGACCMRPDHGLRAVLEAPPVRWIGTISYALYLVHVTAIGAVRRLAPSQAADAPFVFAAGLILALPLAYALHRAVDVPLQVLRARLRPAV
jgi:peptidoglycan/LPS O-acetylase OafA/YrhL